MPERIFECPTSLFRPVKSTKNYLRQTSKSEVRLSGGYKKDVLKIRPRHLSCYVGFNVSNDIRTKIEILRKKHEGLLANQESDLGLATKMKHHINIGHHAPINQRLRRTPEAIKLVIKTKIKVILSNIIIRESHSPSDAVIVMVPLKDGEMHMCIDFRALNQITFKDKYPLPRIDDTIDALYGSVDFSTR
ncbi:Uncharacterized protein APZ42_005587, partial [Daphnia magna]